MDTLQEQPMPLSPHEQTREWYGPPLQEQFTPLNIIMSILLALFKALWNTCIGAVSIGFHYPALIKSIYFAYNNPQTVLEGIVERAQVSLRANGIVFTAVSSILMFVLPGASLFGKLSAMTLDVEKKHKTMHKSTPRQY